MISGNVGFWQFVALKSRRLLKKRIADVIVYLVHFAYQARGRFGDGRSNHMIEQFHRHGDRADKWFAERKHCRFAPEQSTSLDPFDFGPRDEQSTLSEDRHREAAFQIEACIVETDGYAVAVKDLSHNNILSPENLLRQLPRRRIVLQMGSFKHPHVFDPLDLEIIDRVYEAAWARVGANEPDRDRSQDDARKRALRQWGSRSPKVTPSSSTRSMKGWRRSQPLGCSP